MKNEENIVLCVSGGPRRSYLDRRAGVTPTNTRHGHLDEPGLVGVGPRRRALSRGRCRAARCGNSSAGIECDVQLGAA